MPSYTVDNPSKSVEVATKVATDLLGDKLVSVSAVNPAEASRVSVETNDAIDSSELSIALANAAPKKAAAPAETKETEVSKVEQSSKVEEPAAPVVAPTEPAAPAVKEAVAPAVAPVVHPVKL